MREISVTRHLPRWLAGAALAALINPLALATPTAQEIVERANQASYYAGRDGRSEARMRIEDSRGQTQTRQFTVLRRNVDQQRQQYLVVFSRPSEYRDTAFLVEKNPAAEDDRWLYLPAMDLVRRIAPGDKRTSFVGAHLFYEDISGRHLDDDTHELIDTTEQHYLIRSRPKDPRSVEFAFFTTWIDREHHLPLRVEYTNAAGEVYRRMESSGIEVIDGYPTPTVMRVQDLASGGHTIVQFRGISYDLDLPANVFTERSLRHPPSQWLERR
ncbi:outer membrane lipoprotein-sorting protein [Marinospirillum sp. MEB164]|uniref:Outer membrane lipoprotein-sorting protein n=1 Tax=Marinospirillum alkalitolerans TaxID=3123374 RepID=A0ABW8PW31_9GAMM